MFSTNMFSLLFLAVTPLLAQAQHDYQTPLKEPGADLAVPLILNGGRTYSFRSGNGLVNLRGSQEVMNDGVKEHRPGMVTIRIPLDPTQPGTMVLDSVASKLPLVPGLRWTHTRVPGTDIPTTQVGIRKGGIVAMDAYTTRLALETPYISLPSEIYDILIQATNPTPWHYDGGYDDAVDCSALERFPDLVVALGPESEEEEDDEDTEERELVITPKQYVLEGKDGRCILLARRASQKDREDVMLGWAAVRGRDVVLDWVNQRTAFGE